MNDNSEELPRKTSSKLKRYIALSIKEQPEQRILDMLQILSHHGGPYITFDMMFSSPEESLDSVEISSLNICTSDRLEVHPDDNWCWGSSISELYGSNSPTSQYYYLDCSKRFKVDVNEIAILESTIFHPDTDISRYLLKCCEVSMI